MKFLVGDAKSHKGSLRDEPPFPNAAKTEVVDWHTKEEEASPIRNYLPSHRWAWVVEIPNITDVVGEGVIIRRGWRYALEDWGDAVIEFEIEKLESYNKEKEARIIDVVEMIMRDETFYIDD